MTVFSISAYIPQSPCRRLFSYLYKFHVFHYLQLYVFPGSFCLYGKSFCFCQRHQILIYKSRKYLSVHQTLCPFLMLLYPGSPYYNEPFSDDCHYHVLDFYPENDPFFIYTFQIKSSTSVISMYAKPNHQKANQPSFLKL